VQSLLAAAERLLVEEGIDAVTTSRVAAECGTSVGGLYRFFPNREAILASLAAAYRARTAETASALLDRVGGDTSLDELTAEAIDDLVRTYRELPGYRILWMGRHLDRDQLVLGDEANRQIAALLASALARRLADGGGPDVERVARVAVEIGDALLQLAFRVDPFGDAAYIAETKRSLLAYVESALEDIELHREVARRRTKRRGPTAGR
jgi:AcrR family transcriptional regulator